MQIFHRNIKTTFYFFVILFNIFLFPKILYADTHIKSGDLDKGGIWNKENSPYILDEAVYVPKEFSLIIKSGVTLMSASSTEPNSITFDGDFYVNGTSDDPVKIYGLYAIYFSHNNTNINNTILDNTGLDFWQSTSTLSGLVIKNSFQGISSRGSLLNINKSKFINNIYGIGSYQYYKGPSLMYNGYNYFNYYKEHGGLGNALESTIDTEQNRIYINDSVILNNKEYGILNKTTNPLEAIDVWWGNKDGPQINGNIGGDKIFGNIIYSPWKEEDPNLKKLCCSNVLFIPGIEASRLYKDSYGYLGTSTNTLWEPNTNADIEKMFLDSDGVSIDNSIYTFDVLDSAYNIKNIYKSFIAMMNSVVADNIINKWLPFPYDWRMGIDNIVYGKTNLSTTSINLIDSIEKLAKESRTGKVIIVAHSNGGLISKLLTKALSEKKELDIIEKVIMIAVPELGTPKAILALLHGYDQSIASGFFLTENNSRTLSRNSLGAYGLLPSRKFFDGHSTSVISDMFSSSTDLFLSTYNEMKSFLTNNSFSKILTNDTNTPIILSTKLIDRSDSIHSIIDNKENYGSTNILSLIGWGIPTVDSVKYEKEKHCKNKTTNTCNVEFYPEILNEGDGTVLVDSNSKEANKIIFLNLKQINDDTDNNINHSNILESKEILNTIKSQVSNTISAFDYGKYYTDTKPVDTTKWLTMKIYSPIDIHIYDKTGKHTGIIKNPTPEKNLKSYENNIKSSFYGDFGKVKIARVPYDDYQIILEGSGSGIFSLDAEVVQYNKVIASTTFSDIDVTPLLNIDLKIPTSTDYFSTSSVMYMDYDGNGVSEYIQNSDEFIEINPKYKKEHKKIKKIIDKISRKIRIYKDVTNIDY